MHDRLAISAAIMVVAGCVLIAAGCISAPWHEALTFAGVVVSVYGAIHWYREFRAARRWFEQRSQSDAIQKAIDDHKRSNGQRLDTAESR